MLTRFDDYPIHQMPVPIAQTGTGDRNHYDRYFFNGYLPEGEVFFGGAMGLYPNRQVIDAALQHRRTRACRRTSTCRAGRRSSAATPTVGPITVEVVEPMKTIRLIVEGAEHGVEADVTFDARSVRRRRGAPDQELQRHPDDGRHPLHPERHVVGLGGDRRQAHRDRPRRRPRHPRPQLGHAAGQ